MITSLNISFFFFLTSWTSRSCFCADINSGLELILNKEYVIIILLSYFIPKKKYIDQPSYVCLYLKLICINVLLLVRQYFFLTNQNAKNFRWQIKFCSTWCLFNIGQVLESYPTDPLSFSYFLLSLIRGLFEKKKNLYE